MSIKEITDAIAEFVPKVSGALAELKRSEKAASAAQTAYADAKGKLRDLQQQLEAALKAHLE